MALSSDATMTMPVQPMYSNYGMGGFGSNGMWGQDFIWLIILFLFAGGWGNGFGNNGQGSETRADIQRGFDTQSIIGKLDGMENARQQERICALQAENQGLKFQASQAAQNAFIAANQEAQTAELIRRINPMPVPAYQVPNPFAGCGCGSCGCGI